MSLTDILLILIAVLLIALFGAAVFLFFRYRGLFIVRDLVAALLVDRERFRNTEGPYRYAGPLSDIIDMAEREYGVELSWGAREMLAIPVIERLTEKGSIDWNQVQESIFQLVRTMREDFPDASHSPLRRRNAVAVIRAFYKRFCNIPPFCSPTDDAR
jgi:hypothetical protein